MLDVAIIGAGAAGLGAAKAASSKRLKFKVLEATSQIGGRARTDTLRHCLMSQPENIGWLLGVGGGDLATAYVGGEFSRELALARMLRSTGPCNTYRGCSEARFNRLWLAPWPHHSTANPGSMAASLFVVMGRAISVRRLPSRLKIGSFLPAKLARQTTRGPPTALGFQVVGP